MSGTRTTGGYVRYLILPAILLYPFLAVIRYWYKNGYLFPDMGTVFIAIDKCDLENGCLKVHHIIYIPLHSRQLMIVKV